MPRPAPSMSPACDAAPPAYTGTAPGLLNEELQRRLPLYAGLLLLFFVARLVLLIGQPDGWLVDEAGRNRLNDFSGVWTAGQLANAGHPEAAYDIALHRDAQTALRGSAQNDFYPWPYPPLWLPVAAVLAAIPFVPSMLAWLAATGLAFAAVGRGLAGSWHNSLLLLACPITLANLYVGQNGFLSAALIGAALLFLPARPLLAGVAVGFLAYKPHLGLLFPLILLAIGNWRAVAAASGTIAVWGLATVALYGLGVWPLFFAQMGHVAAGMQTSFDLSKLQSLFGFALGLGLPRGVALSLHGLVALALAVVVTLAWRRPGAYDLKAALLAATVVLISPYVFSYDLLVLTVAQAFLIRHAITRGGLDAIELGVIVLVNAMLAGLTMLPVPLGAVAALAVAGLAVRRMAAEGFTLTPSTATRPAPAGLA